MISIEEARNFLGYVKSVRQLSVCQSSILKYILEGTRRKGLIKIYGEDSLYPEYLDFLSYLESINFPSQRLIYQDPTSQNPLNNPFILFSYEKGINKQFFEKRDVQEVSKLLARLHLASQDYDLKNNDSKVSCLDGIIHGDTNLDNIVFSSEGPILIDFDHMKRRTFMRDLSEFSFYLSLIDLTRNNNFLNKTEIRTRLDLTFSSYDSERHISFVEIEQFQSLFYKKIIGFQIYSEKEYEKKYINKIRLNKRINALEAMRKWKI